MYAILSYYGNRVWGSFGVLTRSSSARLMASVKRPFSISAWMASTDANAEDAPRFDSASNKQPVRKKGIFIVLYFAA